MHFYPMSQDPRHLKNDPQIDSIDFKILRL